MNRERISSICTRTGGFIGVALFLIYGLKASFVYGGMMGVVFASTIQGTPVGGELVTRIIVAGGMVMGVLAVLFFMTVLGGVLGTAFYEFVFAPILDREEKKAAALEKKTAEAKAR